MISGPPDNPGDRPDEPLQPDAGYTFSLWEPYLHSGHYLATAIALSWTEATFSRTTTDFHIRHSRRLCLTKVASADAFNLNLEMGPSWEPETCLANSSVKLVYGSFGGKHKRLVGLGKPIQLICICIRTEYLRSSPFVEA